MIQAFYTVAGALRYRQTGIDITANNVANADTVGFKKSEAVFKDNMYRTQFLQYPDHEQIGFQTGTGAKMGAVQKDMSQGPLRLTERPLDLAILGDDFFQVTDARGNIAYRRGGSFEYVTIAGMRRITDGTGHYVTSGTGTPIGLANHISDLQIDSAGRVTADGQPTGVTIARVSFANPEALESTEGGLFFPTEASGAPMAATGTVQQGYLERSNVDMAGEMANLIKHQRLFQMNARIMAAVDEMQSMANQLRR